METQIDPLIVFPFAFAISGLTGLCWLLGSPIELRWDWKSFRTIIAVVGNSGSFGVGFAFFTAKRFSAYDDIWMMYGFCTFFGLMGSKGMEWGLGLFQAIVTAILSRNINKQDGPK